MKQKYRMSDEQLAKLLDACKPVPYMIIGDYLPRAPQQNANDAWHYLGQEMGFDGDTAEDAGTGDVHDFIAEPTGEV